jgi:hypothetical protein
MYCPLSDLFCSQPNKLFLYHYDFTTETLMHKILGNMVNVQLFRCKDFSSQQRVDRIRYSDAKIFLHSNVSTG